MVEFLTLGVKPIDLKSANLLDEVNAIQLEGISADQNVMAGLYEVAFAVEWEPESRAYQSYGKCFGGTYCSRPAYTNQPSEKTIRLATNPDAIE